MQLKEATKESPLQVPKRMHHHEPSVGIPPASSTRVNPAGASLVVNVLNHEDSDNPCNDQGDVDSALEDADDEKVTDITEVTPHPSDVTKSNSNSHANASINSGRNIDESNMSPSSLSSGPSSLTKTGIFPRLRTIVSGRRFFDAFVTPTANSVSHSTRRVRRSGIPNYAQTGKRLCFS